MDKVEVSELPLDSGLPFKFEEWRKYQRETVEAILNSDKTFFILEAPTGLGKSPVAIAVSNLFHKVNCEKHYVPNGKCACGHHTTLEITRQGRMRTLYVVSTKQLQEQIQQDFPNARTVKGRQNFICPLKPENYADACLHELSGKGGGARGCPKYFECDYFIQRDAAVQARLSVHNYAYYLNAKRGCLFDPMDLVILDEGHLTENALMSFSNVRFSRSTFELVNLPFPPDNRERVLDALDELQHGLVDRIRMFEDLTEKSSSQAIRELKRLKAADNRVEWFLRHYREDWLMSYHPDRRKPRQSYVEFRPVWVSAFGPNLWKGLKDNGKVLIMSATIGDPDLFCEYLGIPREKAEFVSLPSTFPVENRPVLLAPVGRLSKRHYMRNRENMVKAIDALMRLHPDTKGVIHTNSYLIADDIWRMTEFQKRIMYPRRKDDKAQALTDFKRSKEPIVIMSPAYGVGVDLEGDDARWQVIVKCPFANIGDEQIAARLAQSKEWYHQDAANRIVQAAGRIVRSAEDTGRTILLDSNFFWLFSDEKLFPPWFKEAVSIRKDKVLLQ